jgi:membrane-bound lytic murein transglycosylase A
VAQEPQPVEPVQPSEPSPPILKEPPPRTAVLPDYSNLTVSRWEDLPGWSSDNLREAWPVFIASCMALKERREWQGVCGAAAEVTSHDAASLRLFFENRFQPWLLRAENSDRGLVTGYYEPLLQGSRTRSAKYRYPLYSVPPDLVRVEIEEVFPALKGQRVRGRLEGGRVVPYYTRGEIDRGQAGLRGHELLWLEDAVALFFLHVQGSGRVRLESGETVRVGYADHNGHPYRSIGKVLIERGELPPEKASMQGIQAWARQNPDKLPQLLAENPAYVFFRELPANLPGPLGTLGVPLTARRSIAIDPAFVPLGAPVYLATSWPNTTDPLNRLMLAQDTGTAIKGRSRADFFWGFGAEAGQLAGRMRQTGRMWVLLPKEWNSAAR